MISEDKDMYYMNEAAKFALNSTCQRSKCGAVIVKENEIIGKGFNSSPRNLESQRRCLEDKDKINKKVTDKTCCIHAEQRAIIDALKNNPDKISNSKIYFIRLDGEGNKIPAGEPYCTICSKMALDVGIKEFVLFHKKGIYVYETEDYNLLSFNYNKS